MRTAPVSSVLFFTGKTNGGHRTERALLSSKLLYVNAVCMNVRVRGGNAPFLNFILGPGDRCGHGAALTHTYTFPYASVSQYIVPYNFLYTISFLAEQID